MQACDLLVANADWLITMDPARQIFRDGAVAIAGGRVLATGRTADVEALYDPKSRLDARHRVVTPGLIDSHIHTAFQLGRGLADEAGAQKFLFQRMYPYEGHLTPDDGRLSAELCVLELMRHGVTTFIDPGNYTPQASARAVGAAGIRAVIAQSSLDVGRSGFGGLPESFIHTPDQAIDLGRRLHAEFDGAYDGRLHVWFSFRGVNNCSDELIRRMKQLADELGTGFQAHACFAKETHDSSVQAHNRPEIERLHHLGVLGPNLLLIHCGWLTPREVALLREYDVKVVAAPSSSMHNGYGNFKMGHVPELIALGVNVGLGSDHASSGIVDICQEMFLAGCLYKEVRLDAEVMPPETVLEMATVNGARCALWDGEIGSLAAGKQADLTLFDVRRPEWSPLYNPVSNLVYSAHGGTVDTVLVGGRTVVSGGHSVTLDEERILAEVEERVPDLLERTGLSAAARPKWPVA